MSKILLIEDDMDAQKVIGKRLTSAGFEVVFANDGYQGTALAHKEKPDLVILDLMMPAGGGLSVLKNIRSSMHTNSTPVVILTGLKDTEYKKKVVAEGISAYFEKPYDPAELIETINNILK